jgi:hypothetical protein
MLPVDNPSLTMTQNDKDYDFLCHPPHDAIYKKNYNAQGNEMTFKQI